MKYNNILWVDDVPEYVFMIMNLGDMLAAKSGLSSGRIIDRVTFAHDLEQARERFTEPRSNPYDLIILDGDFPVAYTEEERIRLADSLQQFRDQRTVEHHPVPVREIGALFTELYDSHLVAIQTPLVVFSMTPYNAVPAFARGLPFYTKTAQERSSFEELLGHMFLERYSQSSRYFVPEERREELQALFDQRKLEWGNRDDFLERYLLAE